VPIVEPEVLLDGEHDIDRTLEVAEAVWAETFKYLADNRVRLSAWQQLQWHHSNPVL
jgi:fructose-bisphosphate aldolase class 1